ncbi:MAG: HPr(Ser) kinase/phosphatase [Myxococcales bacterium]|jgi:HPr kinase/phosphorylase|nr:HPr(Ser) kinase/phosphatase [Myxococcales bacterium]
MKTLTVEDLLAHEGQALQLTLVAGREGLNRSICSTRIQKSGLALTGFVEQLHPDRIQIFGNSEITFLTSLSASRQAEIFETLFAVRISCLVVTRDLALPDGLTATAERRGVPLFRTALPSHEFIQGAQRWLERELQPYVYMHGEMLDVFGVGTFILGKSGIGKSECALDLVMRGHRLTADDVVKIWRKGDSVHGACSELIQHHMEIRGLGIINIKDLFGAASVRQSKKIELVIELVDWNPAEEYDRLGTEERTYSLLDVAVPFLVLPVRPGRSTTTIIEVAARNQLLKQQGVHSARAFQERFHRSIAEQTPWPKRKPG